MKPVTTKRRSHQPSRAKRATVKSRPACAGDGPRWIRRKEARPAEIIAAALQGFGEQGYAATRIDDIATRAGVTKGTVYLYFKSKEELFAAVIRDTLASTVVSGEELVQRFSGSTRDLMREMAQLVWHRIGETDAASILKLLLAEAHQFPELAKLYYHAVLEPSRALNRRIIERGIKRGELRNVDPDDYAPLLIAPAVYLLLWRHSFEVAMPGTCPAPQRLLETYVDMVMRSLQRDDKDAR